MPSQALKRLPLEQLRSAIASGSGSSKLSSNVKAVSVTVGRPHRNLLDNFLPRLAYRNPDVSFQVTRLAEPSTKSKDPKLQSQSEEVAGRIKSKAVDGGNAGSSADVLSELIIDFHNAPSRTISLNDLKSGQILNEILTASGSSAEPHNAAPVSNTSNLSESTAA